MKEKPLFTVSGLRGIIGDTLTIPVVISYTEAFARFLGGSLYIVGQDTRPHSLAIKMAVISTLLAMGKEVVDLGVVPTPTLLYSVRKKGASGGVMITASHNPAEWNALKFVNQSGLFLESSEVQEISRVISQSQSWAKFSEFKPLRINNNAIKDHIQKILESSYVDVKGIRRKRLRVICDCINGAAFEAIPMLLETLGCDVIALNCDDSGEFLRNPEPRKEYLGELESLMYENDADVAFATDPDGDRLVVGFKETGILSEEYTVPLAAHCVLKKERGNLAVNFSTSMMVEEIARWHNVDVFRSPVGEANVVSLMNERHAIAGGEGNGGVIVPAINPCRDSLVGIALILSLMVEENVVELISRIPKYFMAKHRVEWDKDLPATELEKEFRGFKLNSSDGMYFRKKTEWIHIRKSNTEPVVRIIAESESEDRTGRLIERALHHF